MGGSDYEPVVSMELTIPRGAYDGDNSQCVDVNITDDSALEGDETFAVELTKPVNFFFVLKGPPPPSRQSA